MTGDGTHFWGIWTPDGTRVTFSSATTGRGNLFWRAADGSSPAERLTTSEYGQSPGSWSPDAKVLAFTQEEPTTGYDIGYDIWILPMEGERTPEPLIRTPFNDLHPVFSPRWSLAGVYLA